MKTLFNNGTYRYDFPLPRKRQRSLQIIAKTIITVLPLISITASCFIIPSLYRSETVVTAAKATLPVAATFEDQGVQKALIEDEGKRFALPTEQSDAKSIQAYKLAKAAEGTLKGKYAIYSAGDYYYSTHAFRTLKQADNFSLLTIANIVLAFLSGLSVMISLSVLEFIRGGSYPEIYTRDRWSMKNNLETESALRYILYCVIGFAWGPGVLLLSATAFINLMFNSENVGDLISLAVLIFLVGELLLSGLWLNVKRFGSVHAIAARVIWGRAKNQPAGAYTGRDTQWPRRWVEKQKIDHKTIEALNPSTFEGSLGDLIAAAKLLGPDK